MKIPYPALLAVPMLAACGPGDAGSPRNATAGAPPAAVPTASPAAAPAPPVDGNVVPRPGGLKTFGDWAVGCDNGARCTMASLLPDDAPLDAGTPTMTLTRDPGPGGRYAIDGLGAKVPRFAVDGRAIGGGADALASAIADGTRLTIAGSGGSVSLKGAAAALRYIDAAQGRAGTTSATVARGAATGVPVPPALPVIRAIPLTEGGSGPTRAQLAAMRRLGRCEDMTGADTPTVARADAGTLIVALPCSAGAYNVIAALFVIRDGTVSPAEVDAPAGFDETGADSQTPVHSLVNADVADGLLTSYAKGRGLGDCGVVQAFAWDGRRLRLARQSEMSECRGNTATITTWRARVLR